MKKLVHIFFIGHKIAKAIRKSNIKCEGINFFLADGRAAGQEVLHVYLHIIPLYKGDGFELKFGSEYGQGVKERRTRCYSWRYT